MDSIIFTAEAKQALSRVLTQLSFSKLAVLTDQNTQSLCLPIVSSFLPKDTIFISVRSGEVQKNLETCTEIWSQMTDAALDRKALMLNLGGGVITDMGGFCASLYKRGIRFLNMPTTLLSQVDASVGGKLGVDFNGLKNHLGVFNEPETVIIAPEFLKTLPLAELRSGYAEILKHGLIRDKSYFNKLKTTNWEFQDWESLIIHSVGIKKAVVEADPKEAGLRKILNFGHTIGHAFESYFLDTKNHLLHGEAIALGMICEGFLSFEKNAFSFDELDQLTKIMIQIYGKVEFSVNELNPILDLCLQDKKNEGSSLLFSLLNSIGDCAYNIPVNRDEIREAIIYYHNL
ncbi:3-dehydroquinate synthase [Algoriphagus alkaliphilus]|uniref:3-dehydroquinate synthase n=1 Tax=Algoriphagus alkaliphilus TaxID=279824 RepID=A0A1G5ZLV2_9BACT|nr:3-dehydroquinate synthase [Algoriphagus alkaliphilus]MBA4300242.1 3-dehydroquinate synthase [Cyclobacterium sp.]SDA95293.1 3-dehydroquinate synthase [Algoriphagus alkaliphilus]